MVGHSAYTMSDAASILNTCKKITVQIALMLNIYSWPTRLCAEDNMIKKIRVAHDTVFI